MNRFELTAQRISKDHGVQVEWIPANREYLVEGCLAGTTAREAERMAKDTARKANAYDFDRARARTER